MFDFLTSFIDKIANFFTLIVSLPHRIRGIFELFSFPFTIILGPSASLYVSSFLIAIVSFLVIYSIVKLVLSLL